MARKKTPKPDWMADKGDQKADPVETQKNHVPESVDGRTLRATGRTKQFATRVSEEFFRRFAMAAARDGLKKTELLELALEAYEREKES